VLVERRLTDTGIGKLLMSATFVTDLCTALALSAIFLTPNVWFPFSLVVSLGLILALPRIAHVAGGKAVLKTAALEKADFGDERFDKVFAFNVAPFWHQPKEALGIVRRHLAPDGAVYLFWDARHTQPRRARDLADQLSERIRLAEFSVNQVLVKDLRPVPAVCVIGRP
jgi:SAM-dependent methyltransferase